MAKNRKTYKAWNRMLVRCYDPAHHAFQYYGARGITVDERWFVFENFLADMGKAPEEMSLGRIDNNKGYSKDNCRWETAAQQAQNKGMYSNNISGVKGVYYLTTRGIWKAQVQRDGVKKILYEGRSFDEACEARKRFDSTHPIH